MRTRSSVGNVLIIGQSGFILLDNVGNVVET